MIYHSHYRLVTIAGSENLGCCHEPAMIVLAVICVFGVVFAKIMPLNFAKLCLSPKTMSLNFASIFYLSLVFRYLVPLQNRGSHRKPDPLLEYFL